MPLQINVNINSGNTSTGGGGGGSSGSGGGGRNSSIFNGPLGRSFARFIQVGARFLPFLAVLSGGAGLLGFMSRMAGESKIANTFSSAIMTILGAMLDMILLPYVPQMVNFLQWLAKEGIPASIEWGKSLYAFTKDMWTQLGPILAKFWTDIQPVLVGIWEFLKTIKRDWQWNGNPTQADWQQNPTAAAIRSNASQAGAFVGGSVAFQGLNTFTNPDWGEKIKSYLRMIFDPLGLGALGAESFNQARRAMGFASGTYYVPQTGMAMLHRGEQVIPARESGSRSVMVSNTFHINTNFDSPFDMSRSLSANIDDSLIGAFK